MNDPHTTHSSVFTQKVLDVVAAIPEGTTLTYAEVATRAGNPKAARAVGMIMSKNYRENVPCHRVVRKDGKMGGYNRGGADRKRELLRQEGALR